MSRLERAIEKALENRNKGKVAPERDQPAEERSHPPPSPVFAPHPLPKPRTAAPKTGPAAGVEPLKTANPHLLVNQSEGAFVSEEYKKLKSMLVQITNGDRFRNTLMLTSTVSGEGKTLTTLNLAICLAQEFDHTVLVVDADLRQPSVHEYLGIPCGKGLIQCLTENYPLSDALVKTGIGKLVVLPAGGRVPNPVELLSSNAMKELVRELKNRYPDRYVLFDTTPILSFAESHALASIMDGGLFVVREGKANLNQVKIALDMLKKNTNLLGVVYNDSRLMSKSEEYYYSYY